MSKKNGESCGKKSTFRVNCHCQCHLLFVSDSNFLLHYELWNFRKKKRSERSWRCFIQKKTWKKPARYLPKRWPSCCLKQWETDGQVPLKDILFLYGPTVLEALILRLIPWAVKLGSQRFTNSLQRKWWPSSKVVIWRVLLLLGGRRNLSWAVWDS